MSICISFPYGGDEVLRLLTEKKIRDALVGFALLVATAGLVLAPDQAIAGAKDGLTLCFNVIVPSLFPFFVLSSLVVDLGLAAYLGRAMERLMRPLFRVSGSLPSSWGWWGPASLATAGSVSCSISPTLWLLYWSGCCSASMVVPHPARALPLERNRSKPSPSPPRSQAP